MANFTPFADSFASDGLKTRLLLLLRIDVYLLKALIIKS